MGGRRSVGPGAAGRGGAASSGGPGGPEPPVLLSVPGLRMRADDLLTEPVAVSGEPPIVIP